MRTVRIFRWIWRANAIVILLVALAAMFGIATVILGELADNRRRRADVRAAPVIRQADASAEMKLGTPMIIEGTQIFRAPLQTGFDKVSSLSGSSSSTETRNILYFDAVSGHSRWLLPSHKRIIEETERIFAVDDLRRDRAPLASAALVKDSAKSEAGDLIVFDATGTKVVPVATGVRHIHTADATGPDELIVLFERGGKYVLAHFDARSLRKIRETELAVPQLP